MSNPSPSVGVTNSGLRWACNPDPDLLRSGWPWHVVLVP
jgi:hypothetical protein